MFQATSPKLSSQKTPKVKFFTTSTFGEIITLNLNSEEAMIDPNRICPEKVSENRAGIAAAQARFEQGDITAGYSTVPEECSTLCQGKLRVPLRLFGVRVPFVSDEVCSMVRESTRPTLADVISIEDQAESANIHVCPERLVDLEAAQEFDLEPIWKGTEKIQCTGGECQGPVTVPYRIGKLSISFLAPKKCGNI
jgi:hypothetical protein